jgi:aminodeoxyfutalosine synthase
MEYDQVVTFNESEPRMTFFSDNRLAPVAAKIDAGERLDLEDGLILYDTHDLLGLGRLADRVRRARHGDRACFVYNQHLNYTNICRNRCRFCAYARDKGEAAAYTYSMDDVRDALNDRIDEPIRELHVVGGLNPALGFDYYLDLLQTIREIRPEATIKAFTAVEIDHLSRISGLSVDATIARLKDAGLAMMPGGGAEVMSDRIHDDLFPRKIGGDRWLEIVEAVHRAGIVTNATMLYGHIETIEERVRHLIRLRDLQDRTGGFSAFIPLAFHSANTQLPHLPPTTAHDDLKNVAAARLMLDNFDHIKAYWVMIGEKLAQTALAFGADDLDGTIIEEKITHTAGATTAKGMTREEMTRLIASAGFTPVERDSFYRPVEAAGDAERRPASVRTGRGAGSSDDIPPADRIDEETALNLFHEAGLLTLGEKAHRRRLARHPEPVVTYVVDRNINYTNICASGCRFCAFFRPPDHPEGYIIAREDLERKIDETLALGGTQILLQGGMNPGLSLDYYTGLLRFIKDRFNIHIHGFSPPEIHYIAKKSDLTVREVLKELMAAGLGSIPGGGAEILVDEVREAVSPNKCTAEEWLDVTRTAHHLGLRTTATMMFGHRERPEQIIAHLSKIRRLQDETGGFTAFIPWTFQPRNTRIPVNGATSVEYLRVLALSRIFLDNIPNIQASWVTQGDKIAQTALSFGANDLGSTMIEENVVAAAGVAFRLPESEMIRLIEDAGFHAVRRDCFYNHLDQNR